MKAVAADFSAYRLSCANLPACRNHVEKLAEFPRAGPTDRPAFACEAVHGAAGPDRYRLPGHRRLQVGDRLRRMSHLPSPTAQAGGQPAPGSVAVHTKVDAALAAAERRFASDPERADLIARTRRFKASWIELAEALSTCQKNQRYTAWGFVSFEEYYRKELHLKTSTVNKLVGTYAFLRKTAPEVFDRDGVAQEYPSLQNIEFLRRAEDAANEGNVAQDLLSEVRRAILDENLPFAQVSRQFRESLFPSDLELEQKKRQQEALRLARKLADALAALEGSVPSSVLEQVQAAIDRLLAMVPTEESAEPAA